MYNITLVCTRHEEKGLCNSDELYKILESIGPEIIFIELPPFFFDQYYVERIRNNLESSTIIEYLESHRAEIIPVESENIPPPSLLNDVKKVHDRIEGLVDVNGFNYRKGIDANRMQIAMYGFQYLNSIHNDNFWEEINETIENGLQKINDEKLSEAYKLWKEVTENRDNEMVLNIYNYSKEHSYNKAMFVVGAGHRKSIMQKIQEYEKKEEGKLNWAFYGK